MDLPLWMAYVGAASALMFLPGPDWAFMLAAGVGERRVVPAVVGLTVGYIVLSLVVAAGLGPLIASSRTALLMITVVGAAYLVYLGVGILRRPRETPSAVTVATAGIEGRGGSSLPLVRRGVGVSALNAKSLVLFVAFLPQFISTAAPWPLWLQLAVLGLTWTAIGAGFYMLLGFASRRLLGGGRPRVVSAIATFTGVAMVFMGIYLAAEQLVPAVIDSM